MDLEFYSQYGEDKILNNLFKRSKGLCVEIGGYDGVTGSNSYFFEQLGWDCLVIEPIPEYFDKIKARRTCLTVNCAVSSSEGFGDFFIADTVEQLSSLTPDINRVNRFDGAKLEKIHVRMRPLDSILEEYSIDKIDFITIDVEGHEMEVLKGFNINKYKPSIIILEDNSNGLDNTIETYLKKFQYVLFKRTGCNDWFTLKEFEGVYYEKADLKHVSFEKLGMRLKLKAYLLFRKLTPKFIIDFLRSFK